MKTTKLLLLSLLSGIMLACNANAAEPAAPAEQRLIGIWEASLPEVSVLEFLPDHTMRRYLTKEEGADKKAHWVDATWKLAEGSELVVHWAGEAGTASEEFRFKLSFDKEDLVLLDDERIETRHRRLGGGLPDKYKW